MWVIIVPTSWVIMRMRPNNVWGALSLMPGTKYMLKECWLLMVSFLSSRLKCYIFSTSIFLLSSSPEAHLSTATLTVLSIQFPEVPALWITTIHAYFPASFALLALALQSRKCLGMSYSPGLLWVFLCFCPKHLESGDCLSGFSSLSRLPPHAPAICLCFPVFLRTWSQALKTS